MCSVYRLRPLTDNTISELREPYLWFSTPSGFNDKEDSNLSSMIESNEIIEKAFSLLLNSQGIEELKEAMKHIGVCCFTKTIPSEDNKKKFPKGKNGLICIEFDKEKLSDYFLNEKQIPDCFKEVIYHKDPIEINSDGNYHFLYKKENDGAIYKSIYEILLKKNRDDFMYFLLTRISEKYNKQNELRIIWAGFHIDKNVVNGYHIGIPKDSIKCIHIYPGTNPEFVEEIKKLGYVVKDYQP